MGETRKIKTKVLFKHETATDWELSSYIPEVGEKVLYDPDEQYNYTRVKYGDGIHRVHDLPFSGSKADWLENDENSSGYIENRPFYEDENGVKKLDNKFLDLENNETIQEITKKVVNADYEQNDEKDLSYIRNRPFHENQIVEEKYTPADAIESVRINFNNIDALLVSTNPYDLDKLISLKMITRHDNIGIQEATLGKEDAKEVNEYGYSFSCQAAHVIVALHKDYRPSVIGEISIGIPSQLPQAGIYITQQGGYGDNDSVLECTFTTIGIKKLDNKFLDLQSNEDFKRVERLVATPDYSINSIDELGYIKNRPFYEDDEKQYTYTNNINSSNYITFKMQLGNTTYSNGKLFRVGDAFLTSQLMGAKVVTKYKKWTQVDNWTIQSSNIVEDTIDGTWLQFGTPTKDNVRYMFIVRDVSYKPSCITSTFTKTGIYMSLWSRSEYPYVDSIAFSAKKMNPLEGRFIDLRGNDRYENLVEKVDDLEDGQDEINERIDDLEEAIESVSEQQQADYADNDKASLAYIKNRPFYDKPELIVDIPFTMSGGYFVPDPDSQAYFVSDKTFTKDELLSKEFPFYFTITDYHNHITQTLSVTEKNLYGIEENGYIAIRVNAGSIDGMYRQAWALFVYDYTKCSFVWEQPTKNGIYFCDCPYYEARFERLFRNGIKYLDNKYIDFKNHPDYPEEPDLTNYVKKTDYATEDKAGLMKPDNAEAGCNTKGDGRLYFYGIVDDEWKDRNKNGYYVGNRHLTAQHTDMIVKVGLTENSKTLTADEKKSAHKWLFGSEPIDISYTDSDDPIPLTFGNHGYTPYAHLQTEKVYRPNELIGATVEWWHDAGHHSTLSLSESMMVDNAADGVTFNIGFKTYIFVAYTTNYKPSLASTAFPKAGVYFSYYDDGDYYWVEKVTKESEGITYLDNKYLDLENNTTIKSLNIKIGDIETALDSILALQNTYLGGES